MQVEVVCALVAFLISSFAFGIGAVNLFKKKKPLYFQILVCAAGCFALQLLSLTVNLWCNVEEMVSVGMFGVFGCNSFLLSANYGTIDKIVDDGKNPHKARLIALIAPTVIALLIVISFILLVKLDSFYAVVCVLVLLPALPASYFNLKHILLPVDNDNLLEATRPCNIIALAFYIITVAFVIETFFLDMLVLEILTFMMSLSTLCLSIFAIKGAKKWEI